MTLTVQRPADDFIDVPFDVYVTGQDGNVERVNSTTFYNLFGFIPQPGEQVRLLVDAKVHGADSDKLDGSAETRQILRGRRGPA